MLFPTNTVKKLPCIEVRALWGCYYLPAGLTLHVHDGDLEGMHGQLIRHGQPLPHVLLDGLGQLGLGLELEHSAHGLAHG